jgi:IS30 family transposase
MSYHQITFAERYTIGCLRRQGLRRRRLCISHETIYRYVWDDMRAAAPCTPTCAVPANNAANATGAMTVGAVHAQPRRTENRLSRSGAVTRAIHGRGQTSCDSAHSPASRPVHTITADNGTEFHAHAAIERATGARFYFATLHHAWERGTNENTNGLLRQCLPKRQSMAHVTQHDCNLIAQKLNRRPRKRLGFRTPEECYER